MTLTSHRLRLLALGTAMAALGACSNTGGTFMDELDWDLRSGTGALDTTDAARVATEDKPNADARGVISYPGYQVAVARRGDTVASVASRVGISADELARYNALNPNDALRDGEVIALPRRVADTGGNTGALIGGASPVDVTSIATTALDRVGPSAPAAAPTPSGQEPVRHRVARGETAFSIARTYNISARALADWNGLGTDLAVREGQYLIIPTASGEAPPLATDVVVAPGAGSPTPEPPSAKKPLPDEKPEKAAEKPKETPPSPDLGTDRTAASASAFAMPVSGKIIRGYAKKKNEGIDIAAAAGTSVKAAADGTVAAITQNTDQTPIIVLRHADNLLTVYAGVDGIKVKKGDKVSRGQGIAAVRAGDPAFVHFEVRRGVDSLDPMTFLK